MKTHSVTILVIIYPQNRRRSHPDPHQMSEQIALRASRFMVSQACILWLRGRSHTSPL